ncbi:transglutaminase domain-containing protein [bacterium]|nr:transglutaminase domain-containing protein [bacterium]
MKRKLLSLALLALSIGLFGQAQAQQDEMDGALEPRKMEFTYGVFVPAVDEGASSAFVWIPVPPSNERQKVLSWDAGDLSYEMVTDPEYGNSFLQVDLLAIEPDSEGRLPVSVSYEVERYGYAGGYDTDASMVERFLKPDNMVTLEGEVAEEAARVAGDAADDYMIARALYDNIVTTVVYDKSREGWGRGDAEWACDARYGNCTDFHSLFIGESRSLGVPARFLMGFPIPNDAPEGSVGGYHCWAEFYDDDQGWIPIDASEVAKAPERREELFGNLDNDRIEFVMGRDLAIPGVQDGPLNFLIYPYVEVDGKARDGFDKNFSYRDL